jgi:hypothetical protein
VDLASPVTTFFAEGDDEVGPLEPFAEGFPLDATIVF